MLRIILTADLTEVEAEALAGLIGNVETQVWLNTTELSEDAVLILSRAIKKT